jgi:hypothetical protein
MAPNDAKPIASPPGMAVAANALFAELLQTLVDSGTIDRSQVITMIISAHRQVAVSRTVPLTPTLLLSLERSKNASRSHRHATQV